MGTCPTHFPFWAFLQSLQFFRDVSVAVALILSHFMTQKLNQHCYDTILHILQVIVHISRALTITKRVTPKTVTFGSLPISPDKWHSPCFPEQDSGLSNPHIQSTTFRYSAALIQVCLINKILQFFCTEASLSEL